MKKKLNNKGFSLVELIIVIAIMAVLIGILAPQFLRYVEKSRLQKDNTAISEIANTAKIAAADDTIYAGMGATTTFTATGNAFTFNAASADPLEKELATVVGTSVKLTSDTYNGINPTITVTKTSNGATVTGGKIIETVSGSQITKTY